MLRDGFASLITRSALHYGRFGRKSRMIRLMFISVLLYGSAPYCSGVSGDRNRAEAEYYVSAMRITTTFRWPWYGPSCSRIRLEVLRRLFERSRRIEQLMPQTARWLGVTDRCMLGRTSGEVCATWLGSCAGLAAICGLSQQLITQVRMLLAKEVSTTRIGCRYVREANSRDLCSSAARSAHERDRKRGTKSR